MKLQRVTMLTRFPAIAALALMTLTIVFARDAQAACFTTPVKHALVASPVRFAAQPVAAALDDQQGDGGSIVGLWHSVFLLGDGPDRYDETFQQFHADGTEMMLSNGLPPVLGNVCVGVWKPTGARTFRLRHMAWNWDADGHFVGTFAMLVTLRIDRQSNTLSGTWVADSFDPSGTLIPEAHAEGTMRGARITVD
jgi:hypothetical protein